MIKYIGKRLLMMIPVLLGVVLVVFSMMYFSPGRAADYMLGDMATEEDKLAFEEQNGLNRPFLVQYVDYVWDVLHGDWELHTATSARCWTRSWPASPTL